MQTRPFLTVVTRACRRPTGLRIAIQSVIDQTCHDLEQVFLLDKHGVHKEGNIRWANRQFLRYKNEVNGDYVYMLDDDGKIIHSDFVKRLKAFTKKTNMPDVILVKTLRQAICSPCIYPRSNIWGIKWAKGARPKKWVGNGSCVVVNSNVWKNNVHAYCDREYKTGGDWFFITRLIKNKQLSFRKLDLCVTMQQSRGRGALFETNDATWYNGVFAQFDCIIQESDNVARMSLWNKDEENK